MLNSKYTTMYGMRTYGHNLGGTATDMYAKQEAWRRVFQRICWQICSSTY